MTEKATDLLKLLDKASLLYLADKFKVPVGNRRERDSAVEALSDTKKATVGQMLVTLPRNRLKEICRELGLDDSGKEKKIIVTRLLGGGDLLAASQKAESVQASLDFDRNGQSRSHPHRRGRSNAFRLLRKALPRSKGTATSGTQQGRIRHD